jgi:hypothetical protein
MFLVYCLVQRCVWYSTVFGTALCLVLPCVWYSACECDLAEGRTSSRPSKDTGSSFNLTHAFHHFLPLFQHISSHQFHCGLCNESTGSYQRYWSGQMKTLHLTLCVILIFSRSSQVMAFQHLCVSSVLVWLTFVTTSHCR